METKLAANKSPIPRVFNFPYNFKKRKFITTHYSTKSIPNGPSRQEVSDYLNEIENRLKRWHDSLGDTLIFIVSGILFLAGVLFAVSIPESMIPVYGLQIRIFVVAVIGFFSILFRHIMLSIHLNESFPVLHEIIQEVENDLDKTACSETKSNYLWVFPINFPSSMQLVVDTREVAAEHHIEIETEDDES